MIVHDRVALEDLIDSRVEEVVDRPAKLLCAVWNQTAEVFFQSRPFHVLDLAWSRAKPEINR